MKIKVKDLVKITHGKLLSGNSSQEIDLAMISTDSRAIKKGEFFIALEGDNFDGNDFVEEVLRKGACGVLTTNHQPLTTDSSKIAIQVRDTTKALQDIASYNRKRFKGPVICITGSNGKTTVKDMAWRLLSSKYNVLRNEGTRNNHIGVPQTLLRLSSEHDMCVLELGTNHKGEIDLLAGVARPTVAVITNIGPSHLEFLGDLEGVFEAKKEILRHLDKKDGLLILNGDDEFLSAIDNRGFRIIKYGFNKSNDLQAEALQPKSASLIFVVNNKMIFELNLLGKHNIYNALAAIAVALNFGIDHKTIREAFLDYKPTYMRLQLERVSGIDILNDCYNSNPSSMMRALEVVKYYQAGAKWIVSGDMLELGKDGEHFHKMIGESIAKSNVEGLVTFGELSKHTLSEARSHGMKDDRLWHCSTHDEIAQLLKKVMKSGDVVLLKGSRSMQMEKVLELLNAK